MRLSRILVTGGAGYIGSHAVLALLRAGLEPVVLDNFQTSDPSVMQALERASGRSIISIEADMRNVDAVVSALRDNRIDAVLHFAGLKAVGESVGRPMLYYDVNVSGSIALLKAMEIAGVGRIVFSSSATVYGLPQYLPIDEDHPLAAMNPYGRSKLQVENIIRDQCAARPGWGAVILRYFNPVGADDSGWIGENPRGVPANLMPFVADVAAGERREVGVFGDDYDTRDGTGVRDYIHVVDLAEAHVAAIGWLGENTGARCFNIGGGTGTSVLEMIRSFARVSGRDIRYVVKPRRPGDVASCYADPSRARAELGWRAERGADEMCRSAWRWRQAVCGSRCQDAT